MSLKSKLLIIIICFLLTNNYFYVAPLRAEDDIEDIQEKIEETIEKKEKVEKELNTAEILLQKNKYQVGVTQSLISKTETDITRRETEIKNLTQRIELNKKILTSYLQEAYFDEQDYLTQMAFSDNTISNLTDNYDQLLSVEEKILALLDDIDQSKKDVEKVKENLADKKEDHEKLLNIHKSEQVEIKEDIEEAAATLEEVNKKIEKLRKELSQLLGSAVSFKNITDAAAFASKVTGIRKDYLLGVLVVESNLGRYTGGCNFKESRMSGYRASIFKDICSELNYDYKKQKVSCAPSGYKGTGGAMGVAQFMPDTWQGYKSSIASVTGHNPPDPWNLTDGVVAMALKLTKVDGVKQHKRSGEAKAYCVYLAGGNWASYCDSKGVNYGEKVLYWADNYEKLLN